MKARAILLASILAATALLALAPSAQAVDPWPQCRQVLVGPDIDQGYCIDPSADCIVLWYNKFGNDTCYVAKPITHRGAPDETCIQLFVGPDIDQGICYDLSRDTCQVWYYRTYQNPGNTCLT